MKLDELIEKHPEAIYIRLIDEKHLEDLEWKAEQVMEETGITGIRVARRTVHVDGVFQPGEYQINSVAGCVPTGTFWRTWSVLNGIAMGSYLVKEQSK